MEEWLLAARLLRRQSMRIFSKLTITLIFLVYTILFSVWLSCVATSLQASLMYFKLVEPHVIIVRQFLWMQKLSKLFFSFSCLPRCAETSWWNHELLSFTSVTSCIPLGLNKHTLQVDLSPGGSYSYLSLQLHWEDLVTLPSVHYSFHYSYSRVYYCWLYSLESGAHPSNEQQLECFRSTVHKPNCLTVWKTLTKSLRYMLNRHSPANICMLLQDRTPAPWSLSHSYLLHALYGDMAHCSWINHSSFISLIKRQT